jgi:hypothetical protein
VNTNATMTRAAPRTLRQVSLGVIIVAHREDTSLLRQTFESEGLRVDEVRGPYAPGQEKFSAAMRCFVNHANAWRIAAGRDKPSIVVEADFVPVRGFADLPAPIPPNEDTRYLGYLYTVGPQIWDLVRPDLACGHGGGTVALLIHPTVATMLLQFLDEQLAANPLGEYSPFDTKIGYWLKDRGVESYIPYRHYGEHGGIGNPEHAGAGLGRPHQADLLQGPLAFLPAYAEGSRLKSWATRTRARVWGLLRLAAGRYLTWSNFKRSERSAMFRYAVGRFVLRRPPGA